MISDILQLTGGHPHIPHHGQVTSQVIRCEESQEWRSLIQMCHHLEVTHCRCGTSKDMNQDPRKLKMEPASE